MGLGEDGGTAVSRTWLQFIAEGQEHSPEVTYLQLGSPAIFVWLCDTCSGSRQGACIC